MAGIPGDEATIKTYDRRDGQVVLLPANERLQFLAGQYLEFLLKDGTRRSFSMGNAPHDDELIQLHVRHVPGGDGARHLLGQLRLAEQDEAVRRVVEEAYAKVGDGVGER